MVTIRLEMTNDFRKKTEAFQKQTRFATIVALTRTANDVKAGLGKEMERVFDRPTRYTLNSLQSRPATKQNPVAAVSFREFADKGVPAGKYLIPQIEGGSRKHKPMERALQFAGFLPRNMFAVPGKGAQLTQMGNLSRGQITKMLSYLRASSNPSQNRPLLKQSRHKIRQRGTRRNEEYFVANGKGRTAHLPPGVYLRKSVKGGAMQVEPVLIYVPKARYQQRLDFMGVGGRIAEANLPKHFYRALAAALRTAW